MKKYKVEITTEVQQEIENIYLYIAEDSSDNAINWYFNLHDKIQTLKQYPRRCTLAEESKFYHYEIRVLLVGSYRILFRIQDQTVQILHVKHAAKERSV